MIHNNANLHWGALEDEMKDGAEERNLWSIVLAGGDGVRTKEFIQRWPDHEKAKQ
jgi:hypothetical protein